MSVRVDVWTPVALTGKVVTWLALSLVVPLGVAAAYGETDAFVAFGLTIAVALALGLGLGRLTDETDLGAREALLMVGLTWVVVSLVGALPYVLAGNGTVSTPVNALFESMSGFTTTGATVMADISFEVHSRSLLLWRQETQWLGGMGIVVLAVAILPELSVGGAQLMDTEAPGPGLEKLTPRIAQTARVLWILYLGLTALEIAVLYGLHLGGLAPRMDLYNAVAHGLTTMPTGGFSPEARSIEAFSAAVQWVIVPFMVAAGANFALFWRLTTGELRALDRDPEFRFALGVMGATSALVAGLLLVGPEIDLGVGPALRHAVFQVVSITTTTGYASTDFVAWGEAAQFVLLAAMFVGGSAGSTGSAVKMVRWLVILKSLRRELTTTVHPDAISPVRLGGRALDERSVRGIYAFTLLYLVVFVVGTIALFVDSARIGLELTALGAMSAVAATLGNVGPGFGVVGPMENYLAFSPVAKLGMVFLMLLGRLELVPLLVLLTRQFWSR